MDKKYVSISLSKPDTRELDAIQKGAIAVGLIGVAILLVAWGGYTFSNNAVMLSASLGAIFTGTIAFTWRTYMTQPAGIKNNGVYFKSLTSRGALGWSLGILLTLFYVIIYWFPEYLGFGKGDAANTGMVALFDPLSQLLKNEPASQWFLYGTIYTTAILFFGFKFLLKYRHNRYQVFRTISVMFFQLGFAFLLPEFLLRLNYPYNDFKNMWPLNYSFFYDYNINGFLNSGNLGLFMLLFGIAMILIISPILTYFYGKRWYCSWVCGCGGLAETAGDPFRQLSSKKVSAWKFERICIHLVTVFAILMTVGVINSYLTNNAEKSLITRAQFNLGIVGIMLIVGIFVAFFRRKHFNKQTRAIFLSVAAIMAGAVLINYFSTPNEVLFIESGNLRSTYGFLIGAAFSGVIGVGFYPLMGSRVWCRFGCPMAAILGFQQRIFSKFRITTNGGQCISCGNCSTYCEMGIDVRAYAQSGQNIVRSSCVGCGICSAVCPRGVLKLENGKHDDRMKENPAFIGRADNLMEYINK